jgi:HEAT repeats
MIFTPDAALMALSNNELVAQIALTNWPIWQVTYVLNTRGPAMLDAVLRGLQHPHPQVRRWCAELLDHNADDRCIEPLLALMDDPVDHVRWQAVHSLSCQRCKVMPLNVQAHVTQRMVDLALNDRCTRVRGEALAALTLRPDAATPEVMTTIRGYATDLDERAQLSKRERAYLRGLRQALRLSHA